MNPRVMRLGQVTVEHLKCRDYGPAATKVPRAVQHTTEGGFESSLSVLKLANTPTFLLGRDKTGKLRAVQMLDVGRTAGALEHPAGTQPTNSFCLCQTELVGYSQHRRWLPDPGVTDLLAHLYGWLNQEWGLPLTHVPANRERKVFEATPGIYGHSDVPDQPAGHWDPGLLDYGTILKAADKLVSKPAWWEAAAKMDPLWAWIVWRDHGAPPALRPSQIPARVPAAWWPRYLVHRGL